MNRKIVTVGITGVLSLGLVFASTSDILADSNGISFFKTPQTEEQKQSAEKVNKNMNEFRNDVFSEFYSNFNLPKRNFTRKTMENIYNNKDEKYKSLGLVVRSIMIKQTPGDIKPYVFINEKSGKGYILEKKSDGQNKVYFIELKSQKWQITETKKGNGTKMEPDLK
ncbi:hypothetical protein [Pseudalkalibacillus salsuginis]|uniref:hypothetical protein n=1 Tax=Pseudalkalibacillus salsuginis TaxID=2910972 RepID=UPI001F46A9EF|nr:hypothetical protein [Pseudalkalibacillus salsuginis]MCF6410678.1 hypothetical protein [Pseudalkalibacillus salsuginis]